MRVRTKYPQPLPILEPEPIIPPRSPRADASVRCVILLSNARDHSLTISATTFDMVFRAVIAAALVGCVAA